MATNYIINTTKGKYAGTCPDCNLMRGDWEIKGTACGRCGHIFETEALQRTLDGEIKEVEDDQATKELI